MFTWQALKRFAIYLDYEAEKLVRKTQEHQREDGIGKI